ncbi:MAG TPA: hypothetical protein PK147_11990 [Saprospiraceae bacterium]|nr:hypothetical protein [Saprospiraceae bacterium]MCB9327105.1 hypothetical protein [Lewinellaceae bacterium]HPQ22570.1 hypothetical protein [Saprospiraceae bacterium]
MQSSNFYHIFNRANGFENLFRKRENYQFFLNKWDKYISPIADTYCYCLMPNHFHFLIRIKSSEELGETFGKFDGKETFGKFKTFQKLDEDFIAKKITKSFSNLFSSYTQAYNKYIGRKGSLFTPNFKKKEITNEVHLLRVIAYIHRNPIHHGFATNYNEWEFSSYNTIMSARDTKIKREKVLEIFGGNAEFIQFHQSYLLELETIDFDLE